MMIIDIIGGGLAGCETAWFLLKKGFGVRMFEMRPHLETGVHEGSGLAELVCSNSLKSMDLKTASGVLKEEMTLFDSLIVKAGHKAKVEAGTALAVDRNLFSLEIEKALSSFENFELIRKEKIDFDSGSITVIASGPMTSDKLSKTLSSFINYDSLYFYDAVAPVITLDSVDMTNAFWESRYGKGGGEDYLNCPMTKEEYTIFYDELIKAETVSIARHEKLILFEACQPVEEIAKKGFKTLLFGPLKPVGLNYPGTDKRPFAVLQLRKDNIHGTLMNLVGFQTRLKFPEQKRVFSMIPALKNVKIVRYGVMHRNTYINSPEVLSPSLRCKKNQNIYFCGQITGVEGYVESALSGMFAGMNIWAQLTNNNVVNFPEKTISGELLRYITGNVNGKLRPMNANLGLLDYETPGVHKKSRREFICSNAINVMKEFADSQKDIVCFREIG